MHVFIFMYNYSVSCMYVCMYVYIYLVIQYLIQLYSKNIYINIYIYIYTVSTAYPLLALLHALLQIQGMHKLEEPAVHLLCTVTL